jgi:hypothetical protein
MNNYFSMQDKLFLMVTKLLVMLFTIHLLIVSGEASLRPGYNGEAEFNTWGTGATTITFPFVNSIDDWNWKTEISVQNVGAVTNTINFKYHDLAGIAVANQSIQLNPGGSQVISPPPNFSGSLVVAGTQPLTAIAIGSNQNPAWSGDRLISYKGASVTSGIKRIQLYPIQRNYYGWNSILAVQYQEGTGSATITLNFTNLANGTNTLLTDILPAYSSKFYDISGLSILGDSFNGSVEIQGSQTITGVVISSNPLSGGGALAYTPIWSGSLMTSGMSAPIPLGGQNYFPRIVRESNFIVHNISNNVGLYNINFFDSNGLSYPGSSFQLPAGGYYNYPGTEFIPSGVLGSAVIASDQPMANIVLTKWPNPPLTSTGYNGMSTGSTTSYVPFVCKDEPDMVTRIGVQNIGSAATDITVTYLDRFGENAGPHVATIPPGASYEFDQSKAVFLADGFKGSAVINSTGQPIAVVGFISRNIAKTTNQTNTYLPLVLNRYFTRSCPGGPGSPPILSRVDVSPKSVPANSTIIVAVMFSYYDPDNDFVGGTITWLSPSGKQNSFKVENEPSSGMPIWVFFLIRTDGQQGTFKIPIWLQDRAGNCSNVVYVDWTQY